MTSRRRNNDWSLRRKTDEEICQLLFLAASMGIGRQTFKNNAHSNPHRKGLPLIGIGVIKFY